MSNTYSVQCDCGKVEATMQGTPIVHAFCHCEDCRELLQVPYHSVIAWNADDLKLTRGTDHVIEFQHPTKRMTRVFCKDCGEVLYNTNAMGWKVVSQLLLRKCNNNQLPDEFTSNAHFFYGRRLIDIEDHLPKRN